MPSSPRPTVVVGGHAGTAAALAGLLQAGGSTVVATAGVDTDGEAAVDRLLADHPAAVVVTTAAPADPTVTLVTARCDPHRVCAVTWHPADERPLLPSAVTVVPAGRIHVELPAVVARLSWT